jgi:hypothetical protein
VADYEVSNGDCFASIAKDKGYYNYKTLYDHADNAAIKTTRPNPNQLVKGDIVKIPPKLQKTVNLTLDGTKTFVVDRQKTKLRVVLTDSAKTPLVPTSCSLTVGQGGVANLPGAQGLVELFVDPTKTSGSLKLKFPALAPPGAPPADPAAANPPANPPAILPSQFRDKMPKGEFEELVIEWDLSVGYLQPKTTTRGLLQRLNNLSFDTPVRDSENDKTAKFVKGYQALKRAAVKDGALASIRDELETFHDQP